MPPNNKLAQSLPPTFAGTATTDSVLDLSSAPPIFILPTHLQTDDLHDAEDVVYQAGGIITYQAVQAKLFLGQISQKKRAAFDLRSRGVWTEEDDPVKSAKLTTEEGEPVNKKRKIEPQPDLDTTLLPTLKEHVMVLKLEWLEQCVKQKKVVPYEEYLVYTGKIVAKSPDRKLTVSSTEASKVRTPSKTTLSATLHGNGGSILARAKADAPASTPSSTSSYRRFGQRSSPLSPSLTRQHYPPKLQRTTTSDFEEAKDHSVAALPPAPEWVSSPHAIYACCRLTPANPVNNAFISQLKKIKQTRILTLDEIGVRAYSTSIASLSAYPHQITSSLEISRLPGCDTKIASLWSEWYESSTEDETRTLKVVQDLDQDTDLIHLRSFWNIWGIGPETARKFYFERGWKDIDDIVEFGWSSLSRAQQIGVKYHDEFQHKIPRAESEVIANIILTHARMVRDIPTVAFGGKEDMECVIVGGYRRGKPESSDVDVILSHRDESKTLDLVVDVVRSLEVAGYITHTLTLHTSNSDRGQATLPYRADRHGHRSGFDTLDKALCVWLDQSTPEDDTNSQPQTLHRRVDIIISPWRTVGCAVLGWSGENTFQRDLRRFVNKTRGWKFDSSGVRERGRGSGRVLDLESPTSVATAADGGDEDEDTWQAREKRLMINMGIGWREPAERCTG